MLSEVERDSLVRWRPGRDGGHYESLFIKANIPERGAAFWLQLGIHKPVAESTSSGSVMAVLFTKDAGIHVAKETFPQARIVHDEASFLLQVGDAEITHGRSKGSVRHETEGEVTWDLSWEPSAFSTRHFPHQTMYALPVPKTKVVTPHLDVRLRGTLAFGSCSLKFDAAPGMMGHNWGTEHGREWVWAHGNAFEGNVRAAFEGISARVRLGRWTSPWLTAFMLEHGGDRIAVNALSRWALQKSRLDDLAWTFAGEQGEWKIEGSIHCEPERSACVLYHDPPGGDIHCINSGLADARVRLLRRTKAGFKVVDTLVSRGTTMLEIGDREGTRGVKILA